MTGPSVRRRSASSAPTRYGPASGGRQAEVRDRLGRLRQEHARKPPLLKRLKAVGLPAEQKLPMVLLFRGRSERRANPGHLRLGNAVGGGGRAPGCSGQRESRRREYDYIQTPDDAVMRCIPRGEALFVHQSRGSDHGVCGFESVRSGVSFEEAGCPVRDLLRDMQDARARS